MVVIHKIEKRSRGRPQVRCDDDTKHLIIEAANAQLMAAFKRSDALGMANAYTADGQLLPPNSEPVRGTAAIRAFWQRVIDLGLSHVSLETVEVEVLGDTAIEIGRYSLFVSGDAVADRGKYLVVWRNEQGRWKLYRDIWSTSLPSMGS